MHEQVTASVVPARLEKWPANVSWPRRAAIFIEALGELLWVEVRGRGSFGAVRSLVAQRPVRRTESGDGALQLVRVAVRDACVCYYRHVKCLQRSAAVARMLRRRGIPAELVVGYHSMPVQWHAWVELDGRVVFDNIDLLPHFRVIDRA